MSLERNRQTPPTEPDVGRTRFGAQELDVLMEAMQALLENLDSDRILQTLVEKVAIILDVTRCSIVMIDRDRRLGRIMATGETPSAGELWIELHKYPEIRKVLESGEILTIDNIQSDPLFTEVREEVRGLGLQALAVIPISIESEVIGTVFLRAERAGLAFTEEELRFCRWLSCVAATAVEHAQLLSQLQASEGRFRQSIENSPNPIFSLDRLCHIRLWNGACTRILAYPKSEIVGKPYFRLLWNQEDRGMLREKIGLVWQGQSVPRFDLELASRLGEKRFFLCYLYVLKDSKDQITECVLAATDVTERRRAERDHLESLATLAGGIAHDFNNSLVQIVGNIDLMRLPENIRRGAGHGKEEAMASMGMAAERMTELTQQLLAFARGGKYLTSGVCLSELVKEELERLESSIGLGVRLEWDFEAELPLIEADLDQLRKVVRIVIQNAVEALSGGGLIKIEMRVVEIADREGPDLAAGTYVELKIKDTGEGMSQETLRRAFEPFFTTRFYGRGLGLAAAWGIVENHQGRIELKSQLAQGSTVLILLPVKH